MELPGLALAQLAHDGRFPLVVIPTCDPSQAAEKLKFRIGSNSKLTQVMVEVFVHPRAPLVRREFGIGPAPRSVTKCYFLSLMTTTVAKCWDKGQASITRALSKRAE